MNLRPLSGMSQKWLKTWSGREDSNLRPLPPENGSLARTRRKTYVPKRTGSRFSAHVPDLITGRGSNRTSVPCLAPGARA